MHNVARGHPKLSEATGSFVVESQPTCPGSSPAPATHLLPYAPRQSHAHWLVPDCDFLHVVSFGREPCVPCTPPRPLLLSAWKTLLTIPGPMQQVHCSGQGSMTLPERIDPSLSSGPTPGHLRVCQPAALAGWSPTPWKAAPRSHSSLCSWGFALCLAEWGPWSTPRPWVLPFATTFLPCHSGSQLWLSHRCSPLREQFTHRQLAPSRPAKMWRELSSETGAGALSATVGRPMGKSRPAGESWLLGGRARGGQPQTHTHDHSFLVAYALLDLSGGQPWPLSQPPTRTFSSGHCPTRLPGRASWS